jgi:hypothetical protein
VEQARINRAPVPTRIKNAPQLWVGLELFYRAFYDLTTCRPNTGFGAGEIPWTATEEYARSMRMDWEQKTRLHYLIRALDRAYLEYLEGKRGEETSASTPPAEAPPSRPAIRAKKR